MDQAAALGRGAGAFIQAEQAVLAGGQVETGQGDRVDLLLGEVGRELLVDGDAGRDFSIGTRVGTRAGADVVVATTDDSVVGNALDADVDGAAGLHDGGVGLGIVGQGPAAAELQ